MDWSELGHAYGAADDVPDLIQSLTGGDTAGALSELYGSITHQGSRYSATVAAIPFLVDVALDPASSERASVLALVQFCAMGYLGPKLDWRSQRALQVGPHERECWDAAVGQWPRIEPLLESNDSRLSGSALVVLSWTGDDSEPVRSHVQYLLELGDATDRLAGYLASTILRAAPTVDLAHAPAGVDRFGWATAAVTFLGHDAPLEAVEELIGALHEDRLDLMGTPFFEGEDAAELAFAALADLPRELVDYAATLLLDAMKDGWVRGADPLSVYLRLYLGEPDGSQPGFSEDQLNALKRLEPVLRRWDLRRGRSHQPLWEFDPYGLPTSPKDLRKWLRRHG